MFLIIIIGGGVVVVSPLGPIPLPGTVIISIPPVSIFVIELAAIVIVIELLIPVTISFPVDGVLLPVR